jgi:hypothetical protein
MKKEVFISILCAGLMLVTPFTTIARENKISNKILEQLDDVDGLVTQIRTVVNQILQKYGHIPVVKDLCNVILNSLGLVGRIIFCVFLYILLIPLTLLAGIFLVLEIDYLWHIFGGLAIIISLMTSLECSGYFNPSFKSLYTLSGTNDILELDCSCLQE